MPSFTDGEIFRFRYFCCVEMSSQTSIVLRSRLYELELRKREEQNQQMEKNEIGWGHQIRSYVMQPYQMVKDLRTGYEKGNVGAVLDGEIDEFLQASLSCREVE